MNKDNTPLKHLFPGWFAIVMGWSGLALAWHRDRYHTPAARAFVDTAREICAEVAEGALLG